MPATLHPVTYTLPSTWAPYLINGDASGLDDEEIEEAHAFLDSFGLGWPVECVDDGFRHYNNAHHIGPRAALAQDCQRYTFLVTQEWMDR